MNIIRMGDAAHSGGFQVLREHGYPHYLLLITKTPALFEYEGEWREAPAGCAVLFRPGQRHSYKALGESYSDFWAHIQSNSPLLYEGFPFGRPIALAAPERFYALFSYVFEKRTPPQLWIIWQRSKGNLIRIIISLFVIVIGMLFCFNSFYYHYAKFFEEMKNNWFASMGAELIYNFFCFGFFCVFFNLCQLQRQYFSFPKEEK